MNKRACYLDVSDRDFIEKIVKAKSLLAKCFLCPHQCGINRYKQDTGICQAQAEIEVAHSQIHMGEEPPLSAQGGAGVIFFSHCNLECVFCQNYQISQQKGIKTPINSEELSEIMLDLQDQKAQNIDLVSPGHYMPLIIEAIYFARKKGLCLPIVYNTNGYESPQTLELLTGLIDIYLPDLKYSYEETGLKYSKVLDYVYCAQKAIKLMYQQVGDLVLDKNGAAKHGLIVRHLVLPHAKEESKKVIDFLKNSLSKNIGLSLMSQYAPCYKAESFPEINCSLKAADYNEIVDYVNICGFEKCWIQELDSNKIFFPDFKSLRVFE